MPDPSQPERHDRLHAFVDHLYDLADREDLGPLAALRRSLQDPSGMAAQAFPHVVPFLPREEDAFRDRMYFLVAALFGEARTRQENVGLGAACRALQAKAGESPSLRARFVALLDAHPEDLGDHLRRLASLLRAHGVALDWEQLLRDLLRARHPDRIVQRAWARDFWAESHAEEDTNTTRAT